MKLWLPLLFVVALPTLALVRAQDPAPKPKSEAKAVTKEKAPVYDEKAVGSEQLAAALARAKRENRRVLVQWGANWCHWCILLADLQKKDAKISKELLYEYDVVKIDIGTWDAPKHADLAAKYGADLKKGGVPYLTVLDADGKVIANQETGPLETGDAEKPAHDPAKVLDFLKSHEAPHLVAQAVYDAALASAQKEGKRVFLHFGAPWCGWCHKLDDWLARPEIASVLDKDFVVVKIDQDRMTGGAEMLARMRSDKDGGIPWFAFLAADGTMVAESVNGKGTIGFPAQPDELAYFKSMLEKTCVKMSKAEIESLVETLVPPKKPAASKPDSGAPSHAN
jgi:thiol:disulfide interchange protein